MLDRRQSAADFTTLHALHVGQHAGVAEVTLRQHVRAEGGFVVGGQGDQVVENARLLGRVPLEGSDQFIRRRR